MNLPDPIPPRVSRAVLCEKGRVRNRQEFQRAQEKLLSLRTLIKDGLVVLNQQAKDQMEQMR